MSDQLGPLAVPAGGSGTGRAHGAPRRASDDAARPVEGERRVITILFCDVVGSTALAAQLDPEEWAEIMNEAFSYMIGAVEEYGGTVARLMGDAVLAFFGAPQAHEDDPQRAVLAGITIINSIRAFAQGIRQDYGLDFRVRVGINTGPVVVGEVGSSLTQEYTAMGDAINLAARMEQTALPGSVQISEDTYRLVASTFDVWPIDDLQVKGKEGTVKAYRVLGIESQPGRQRGIQGIETPLVGRAREYARLSNTLDALGAGESGITYLIGEAGLGKSRLIAELRRSWREKAGKTRPGLSAGLSGWTEFVAVSYGASRPYDMLKRQLRTFANIRESDPPSLVHTRLSGFAGLYPPELGARVHDVFGYLLGDAHRSATTTTDGEAFRRELHDVLREAVLYQVEQGPAVYVVDDAHWADPASMDAIRSLLPLVHDHPLLFVFAMRPDWATPAWNLMLDTQVTYAEYCASVYLEPLTSEDSRELADLLLGRSGMPASLLDLILEKGEGNPFFLEEVISSLLDSGAVAVSDGTLRWQASADAAEAASLIGLPGNVQALLTARIDRLDRGARRILQLASVIGRTFPIRVLSHIADGTRLDDPLKTLVQADLVRNATTGADQEYAFRHALTRDAAYSTILHRQRRRYHRQVAEAIETVYADRIGEEAPRLAYHFAEGNDIARSVHYYAVAGESASRIYANAEAVEHCTRGIELALRALDSVGETELIRLFALKGRAQETASQYDEALRTYEALEQLGRDINSPRLQAGGLVRQATIYLVPTLQTNPERGRTAAERGLELAMAAGDLEAAARAHWCLLLLYLNPEPNGQQAVEHGEQALALARESGSIETLAFVMHDIARAYGMVNRHDAAEAAYAEARDLWEELQNQPMLTDVLSMWAQLLQMKGQPAEAARLSDDALAISTRIGNLWGQSLSAFTLGTSYLELGRVSDGLQLLWYSLVVGEKAGFLAPRYSATMVILWVHALLGLPAFQEEELEEQLSQELPETGSVYFGQLWTMRQAYAAGDMESAFEIAKQLEQELFHQGDVEIAFTRMILAEVAVRSGHYQAALDWTEQALRDHQHGTAPIFTPTALMHRAEALSKLGDTSAAIPLLHQAAALAREQEAGLELAQILPALAVLEAGPPDAPTWATAREAIMTIASQIKERPLREAFLSLPNNQQVLATVQAGKPDGAAASGE